MIRNSLRAKRRIDAVVHFVVASELIVTTGSTLIVMILADRSFHTYASLPELV
jgi:hypothetical protein